MRFVRKCNELVMAYREDYLRRRNDTLLLHPGTIPVARYILHAPLKKELLEEHLIKKYKNKFPNEYIKLLSFYNGMSLYLVKVNFENGISFASSRFSIFGLPLTPTSVRINFGEEPFDVRMMDLERNFDIPSSWLKVAKYRKHMEEDTLYEVFIDTEDEKVYCCKEKTSNVDAEWNCLDDCLCDIFDYLSDTEWEFDYKA